ncbi:hypothetical protein BVRB_8g189850 [Beta vulgaris subsp. vulgaris]|nr:hypothetical protein BVRB_8g189850 [Beta vulgaris subsp. vulgaris]
MFYSHQLLARKAPLGQIWFEAVTLPENNADVADVEQSIDYSSKFMGSATFQQSAYFAMQPQQHLQKRKLPARRKAREAPCIMDNEQTMIPSYLYQTWLQDSADVRFKRPKIAEHAKAKSTVKLAKLVDLPPVALSCGLVGRNHEVYYPKPLLDLWITSMQPLQDSPSGSGRTTSPRPPEPSLSSPPHGQHYQDPPEMPMGDFGNRVTSDRIASQEKLRSNVPTGTEVPMDEFNLMFNGVGTSNPNAAAANSGTSVKSFSVAIPGPGLDFLSNTSDSYPERLRKKRPSSTKFNSAGLESLDEENQWIHEAAEHNLPGFGEPPQRSFKIPRRSRHGPTPDHGNLNFIYELLVYAVAVFV